MRFVAKAKYIRCSPYKLRPLAAAIRGKGAVYALGMLKTAAMRRAVPMLKVLESAVANAKDRGNVEIAQLLIKEFRVDQGPMFRYFKPGAMGRSMMQKKRLCHLSVILESKDTTNMKEV
jgi:large subunit ribosomal protein L22